MVNVLSYCMFALTLAPLAPLPPPPSLSLSLFVGSHGSAQKWIQSTADLSTKGPLAIVYLTNTLSVNCGQSNFLSHVGICEVKGQSGCIPEEVKGYWAPSGVARILGCSAPF